MLFANPLIPVFEGLKKVASGTAHGQSGTYTSAKFLADFPQFSGQGGASLVPDTMLANFVNMANSAIFPDEWGEVYEYAAGLYVAHHCTLFLETYAPSGTAAGAVGSAQNLGVVKTATMGDTSVSYDNSAVIAGTEKWGAWNATKYGAQLVTMARSQGIAGAYVM